MESRQLKDRDFVKEGRWKTFAHLALRIGLMFMLFIQVNYLGCRRYATKDLSRNQKFTLSERSAGFLKGIGSDVQIITAFLGTSDILPEVKGLVGEYARVGRDRISVEMLDLSRSRSRIAELQNQYKLDLNGNQIVVISESGRVKKINAEELVTRDGNNRIREFRGEEKLTSALLEVTEQQQKKVYIIIGSRRGDEVVPITAKLQELLLSQNARLEALNLKGRQIIPADADAVFFPGNTSDLNKSEMEMVKTFWQERRGGLMILLDPAADTPNLKSLIHQNGVFVNTDRVLSAGGIAGLSFQKTFNVQATIMPGSGPTRDLPLLGMTLAKRSQSLRVQSQDELYLSQNIKPEPILMAVNGYWGETEFDAQEVMFDPDIDTGPPEVFLAAAIQKGAPGDFELKGDVSRMVVVGNPDLISPGDNYQKNANDFCMASLNWVMSRDKLLGIAPRQPSHYDLAMGSATFGLLQSLIVWVFPTVLLFCGALIWYRRRA